MSEFTFPEQRFLQAGVPESDVEQMRREFNSFDLTLQRAVVEHLQSLSVGALRDYVQTMRDAGRIKSEPEASESVPHVDSDDADVEDDEDDTKGDSETSDDDSRDGD